MQFSRPTPSVLKQIRAILVSMPTTDLRGQTNVYSQQRKDALSVTDLDQLITELKGSLERDFTKTSVDSKTAPWLFDYVVFFDGQCKACLNVMTRLHHPTKAGNIFYGTTILKVESGYLAWVA